MILVRPSRVIAVASDGQRKIGRLRHVVRLAVVQRFKLRQLIGVLLDQIRQFVHQDAALRSAHLAPRALVERRPRRRHGLVHIRGIGLRHFCNHFTRRRIDRGESFSRYAVNPFSIDQQFCRTNLDIPFQHCRCRRHVKYLLFMCRPDWVGVVPARSRDHQVGAGQDPSSPACDANVLRGRRVYPRKNGGKELLHLAEVISSCRI